MHHSRVPPSTSSICVARGAPAAGGPGRTGSRCRARRPGRTTRRRARSAGGSAAPPRARGRAPRCAPRGRALDAQVEVGQPQLEQLLVLPSAQSACGSRGPRRLARHESLLGPLVLAPPPRVHAAEEGGVPEASTSPAQGAPRYRSNQRVIATVDRMRLGVLRQPCPSSGKSTYSTGTPRFFRLSTTCSASTTGTLVSLAPWRTIVGAVTRSTLWIGDSAQQLLLRVRIAVLDLGDRGHPGLGVLEEGLEVDDAEEIRAGGEESRVPVRPAITM